MRRFKVSWRGVLRGTHSKTFATREEAERFQRETLGAGPVVQVKDLSRRVGA